MDMGQDYTHAIWGGKYRFNKHGDQYVITIIEYSEKLLPLHQKELGWKDGLIFDPDDFNRYFRPYDLDG